MFLNQIFTQIINQKIKPEETLISLPYLSKVMKLLQNEIIKAISLGRACIQI